MFKAVGSANFKRELVLLQLKYITPSIAKKYILVIPIITNSVTVNADTFKDRIEFTWFSASILFSKLI